MKIDSGALTVSRAFAPLRVKAVELHEADIEEIQSRALRSFDLDLIWAREFAIANDQVDRTFEAFDHGHLKRFGETLVDKSLLLGHEYRGSIPQGRFYKQRLGREAGVRWLYGTAYTIQTTENEHMRSLVDGGVAQYGSIGCRIDRRAAICGLCNNRYYSQECEHYAGDLYDGERCSVIWTWRQADAELVETVEYSLVYLGAQYNAGPRRSNPDGDILTDRAPAALLKSELFPVERKVMLVKIEEIEEKLELVDIAKPYPNEHACRLRDPGDFQEASFRRMSREHDGKKYYVIMGRLEGEDTLTEQAYRYPKSTWTATQAKSHCRAHDGSFEAASGGEEEDSAECPSCDFKEAEAEELTARLADVQDVPGLLALLKQVNPNVADAVEKLATDLANVAAEPGVTQEALEKAAETVAKFNSDLEAAHAENAVLREKAEIADALLAARRDEITRKANAAGVLDLIGDVETIVDPTRLDDIEAAVNDKFDEKFPPQGKAAEVQIEREPEPVHLGFGGPPR